MTQPEEQLRAAGYRFRTRHRPEAGGEPADWAVVVHAPDGRILFPSALDEDEAGARRRAVAGAMADLARRTVSDDAE
ncbi:hypothetical protein FHX82_007339 [Amycolatopsis bartoniae]|uniref:Uncharacterized protein n=1 Tax=Amycolatopsis bartoniae TaxID=941986 RepID=A0A8H9M7P4_9PSEU|nr:hypothetical protein [Amycolatopsis bartoniae]MBB2940252.1 hypothetical protein [Amycolatopsis bartoniae]TVT10168.1 hypothetical protein FNH07_06225 [Amycolatopsis bartoniae]GHF35186.1 hypothetical protein GCM10017566_04890 [Amycolatopsis bartoniae]